MYRYLTPEAAQAAATARRHPSDAKAILALGSADVAAGEANLAPYHAVEAFVFEHIGKMVKTPSGLHCAFARLA